MSKRKTSKKKTNLSRRSVIIGIIGLTITLMVVAQLCFNYFVWRELQGHSTFRLRTLIVDAARNLDEIRKSPEGGQRIPEARLALPKAPQEVGDLRYMYNESVDNEPAQLEISTKELSQTITSITAQSVDMDELFERIEEAQACMRGFTLYFGETNVGQYSGDTMSFVAKKRLADGREVHVWREKNCGDSNPKNDMHDLYAMMDDLEAYLLQMQSY